MGNRGERMMIRRAPCLPHRLQHRFSELDAQGFGICAHCKQREMDIMQDYQRRKYGGHGKGKKR